MMASTWWVNSPSTAIDVTEVGTAATPKVASITNTIKGPPTEDMELRFPDHATGETSAAVAGISPTSPEQDDMLWIPEEQITEVVVN